MDIKEGKQDTRLIDSRIKLKRKKEKLVYYDICFR